MTTDLDVVAAAPDARQAQKSSIRPFTYRAPQNELEDGGEREHDDRDVEPVPACALSELVHALNVLHLRGRRLLPK